MKYTFKQRVIHWIVAVLLTLVIALGFLIENGEDTAMTIHLITGLVILAFTLARIYTHIKYPRPLYPDVIKPMDIATAKFVQVALMLELAIQPTIGLGAYLLPDSEESLHSARHLLEETHEWNAWIIMLLVGLHVAGTLKHMVVGKVNLIERIW